MSHPDGFVELLDTLQTSLVILSDKPEETAGTTARALWLAAANQACSAESAGKKLLPALNEAQRLHLKHLLERRLAGVPLAHLTGWQYFMGLDFLASSEALVPRKETEILGRAALDKLHALVRERGHATVIDVCTGSGNLAIILAHHEPHAKIFAADISPEAVALAHKNVLLHHLGHRVEVCVGDLLAPFASDRFRASVDLVVCNPPYISSAKVRTLPQEISDFEPTLAFDGGPLGVNLLGRLIKEVPTYLKPASWFCFEIGRGQARFFERSLNRTGAFARHEEFTDITGATRALALQTP